MKKIDLKDGYIVFNKEWNKEEVSMGLKVGIRKAGSDMFASFKVVRKKDLYDFMCKCFPEFTHDKKWEIARKLFYKELKDYYEQQS